MRYMSLIPSKPQRLYCKHCDETYSLPQGGAIKLYKVGRKKRKRRRREKEEEEEEEKEEEEEEKVEKEDALLSILVHRS